MHPSVLTCYESPFPKVRVGKEYDGGYVIVDLPNPSYDLLLAGGIETDISFEEQFIAKYPSITCYACDGTITSLPTENPKITFINKNIGYQNNDTMTNLQDLIDEHSSIFVKMDIEGGEIPWLSCLTERQMNKFDQIVMEFHAPFSEEEVAVFKKLNKNHYLVHFHGNNNCGLRLHNGILIPNVFECTYLHKKYFTAPPKLNTETIPSSIDMPNIPQHPDIFMNHPPFVTYDPHCFNPHCFNPIP